LNVPVARLTAGRSNDLWGYSDRGAVTRINADGTTSVLIGTLSPVENDGPYGAPYVMDGFRNLLISGELREGDGNSSSIIWRVSPATGAVSVFTAGKFYPGRLLVALGPNGDIWV